MTMNAQLQHRTTVVYYIECPFCSSTIDDLDTALEPNTTIVCDACGQKIRIVE